ncbi:MAG: twitching motility protein PilT [Candidatus Thermoplasmatota archaeon]|nr:twitching motility protein PilT [Euryarchaeota archaeon]MBU4032102.1 twitching motility protein PilT [Candidatus Thermoplasmatota archaeon]MBU4071266.1 twitching motility protein PilT [Candidatus Thermoplasmatota archaeon]MBU4144868.1 twitching motility protein PilT [Candidatus Thermoplasmatota archaeon]MBU4592669.1 twitching motility protein PilT [Candidatus Thermoplasmatota archaeon]
MRYVVADTNALIAPFKRKFNIDMELERILGSYTIVVPEPLLGELEKLAETNIHARGALKLAKSRDVRKTRSRGDNAVLELAKKVKGIVMTNDAELISRARKAGLNVIRLREGCRLQLVAD